MLTYVNIVLMYMLYDFNDKKRHNIRTTVTNHDKSLLIPDTSTDPLLMTYYDEVVRQEPPILHFGFLNANVQAQDLGVCSYIPIFSKSV